MAELIVVLVVVGGVVLAASPFLRSHRRRAQDQPAVTDAQPVPPSRPVRPIPGSATDRKRKQSG